MVPSAEVMSSVISDVNSIIYIYINSKFKSYFLKESSNNCFGEILVFVVIGGGLFVLLFLCGFVPEPERVRSVF